MPSAWELRQNVSSQGHSELGAALQLRVVLQAPAAA